MKVLNFRNKKGFTLIELIVVMAVFLFIIGAAIGIFLSIVKNQKKILAEQQVLNQISYVEEYMSKALRMVAADLSGGCISPGYIYLLTRYNGTLGAWQGIKFINQSDGDACQEFFLAGTGTALDPYILKEIKNGGAAVDLTPNNLQFDSTNPIRFAVNGSASGCGGAIPCGASNTDPVQPRVTILLNIKIAGDSQEPNKIIQTTVSQRNLNVK